MEHLPLSQMEQAKIIGHKIKELWKNCTSPVERVSIEIVYIMQFTAKKIDTNEWYLFSDHFIGLFDVFVVSWLKMNKKSAKKNQP